MHDSRGMRPQAVRCIVRALTRSRKVGAAVAALGTLLVGAATSEAQRGRSRTMVERSGTLELTNSSGAPFPVSWIRATAGTP